MLCTILWRGCKYPKEHIKTEYAFEKEGVVADVWVESRRLAIEVETFYGTGIVPWRKLERTIEKYLELRTRYDVREVWIVMPPLQTVLYLGSLIYKLRELRESGCDFIKLYTINFSKGEVMPIEEVFRRLRKLFQKV